MKSKSIKGNSPEEIKIALAESLTDGFKPTLAIVFLSFKQDLDAVCKILDSEVIQIFGATSSGEFISSEISEGSIAVMLLDMIPAYFKLMFLETGDSSDFEIAKQIGEEGKKLFANPAFILASGWSNEIDGEEIIKGIEDGFGDGATIFGGMAGDDLTLTGPKAFTLGKSSITGWL
ncbi:MAG TPA: FIST N-terminal domain-containing protein [Ignavibacteriaceae bacterium]|nr:FIST N-terminal domain-containing protein [Ignavibacteriaceae bacterium]